MHEGETDWHIPLSPVLPHLTDPVILVACEVTNTSQHEQTPKMHVNVALVTTLLDDFADNSKFFYSAVTTTAGMSGAPIILRHGAIIGVGMHAKITTEGEKGGAGFPTAISSVTLTLVLNKAQDKLKSEVI
jgi:hypothetical protein